MGRSISITIGNYLDKLLVVDETIAFWEYKITVGNKII